ncbi:Chromosome partition protein Smc [Carpediemonas membranifera]|uniref:Chromosome partition protein Smc n=1 Tax=Carpediemonas membranifera TaxID=201153 RepID=A0A8J6BEE2_9EUKA|nr:Chromosome partition protein Smc [Carpediemonas membranifera]|eukprot:KAG9395727.1 Chromosome partition protein Smc [Carpediemonas membranifera]
MWGRGRFSGIATMMKDALAEDTEQEGQENEVMESMKQKIALLEDERRASIARENALRQQLTEKEQFYQKQLAETRRTLAQTSADAMAFRDQVKKTTNPPITPADGTPVRRGRLSRSNSLPLSDSALTIGPRQSGGGAWERIERQLNELNATRTVMAKLKGENTGLKAKRDNLLQTVDLLESQLDETKAALEKERKENSSNTQASKDNSAAAADVESYKQAIAAQRLAFDALAADYDSRLAVANSRLAQTAKKLAEAEKELCDRDSGAQLSLEEHAKLQQTIRTLTAEKHQLNRDLGSAMTAVDRLSQQVHSLATSESDRVDVGIAKSIIVSLGSNPDPAKRAQVLEFATNVMKFDRQELVALGLALAPSNPDGKMTLGRLWVEFLESETT